MAELQTSSATSSDDEVGILDYVLVLAKNMRLLILGPLAIGLVSLGISYLIPPTYTAVARILPPVQNQSATALLSGQLGAISGILGSPLGIKNPADQYVALLQSNSVYDAIILRFDLRKRYKEQFIEDTRDQLEKRTKVFAGIKDGLISIEAEDEDPKTAAAIANAFIEELQRLSATLAITEAAQRRLFFERQVKSAKDDLTKAELALRRSGVTEAALKTVPQATLEAVARLQAQITAQEIKIASLRAVMTPSNPEYRLAMQELVALRAELSKLERRSPPDAANKEVEYIAMYRDFKYYETLFELMAKQYELARLDEAREGAVIQAVDVAQPPEQKTRPRKMLITVLMTLAGFLTLALFVFVREAIQRKSAQPETVEKLRAIGALLKLRRL